MASALRRPASAQLPEAFQVAARAAWAASGAAGDGGSGSERPGMLADVSDSLARLGLANSRGAPAGGGVLKMDICLKLRDRCGRKVILGLLLLTLMTLFPLPGHHERKPYLQTWFLKISMLGGPFGVDQNCAW